MGKAGPGGLVKVNGLALGVLVAMLTQVVKLLEARRR